MRARKSVRFAGRYILDSQYTAKLQAAHMRSVLGNAPDESMLRRGIESAAIRDEAITMTLRASELALRWASGGETYPVRELADGPEESHVVLFVLDRYPVRYTIEELSPDVIRLANRLHELHQFAWRRTGDA